MIVTLGLVEAWVDTALDCYLNRMPPTDLIRADPDRYQLEVMDVFDAWELLAPAFRLLTDKKVILTVSPVAFFATFSGEDVVIANSFSKAVLRVCARRFAQLPNVDYLPSYEIAALQGFAALKDDNVHVRGEVVASIVQYMLALYEPQSAAGAGAAGG